jgi:hypothetical protein
VRALNDITTVISCSVGQSCGTGTNSHIKIYQQRRRERSWKSSFQTTVEEGHPTSYVVRFYRAGGKNQSNQTNDARKHQTIGVLCARTPSQLSPTDHQSTDIRLNKTYAAGKHGASITRQDVIINDKIEPNDTGSIHPLP